MSSNVEMDRGDASSKEIRRARVRRLVRRLMLWVALPTLLGIVYYGFWAAPQYDSVSLVSVQSSKDAKVVISKRDSKAVKEYMLSRDMLSRLSSEAGWAKHYASAGDRWANLAGDAGPEEQYRYYLEKTRIAYLDDTASLELRVRAFSGKSAQAFANALIDAAEQQLAGQYQELIASDLAFAETQAKLATDALAAADAALSQVLQRQGENLGPGSMAAEIDAAHFQVDLARRRLEEKLVDRDAAQLRALEGKQRLVVISAPSEPSQAAHPRRLWGIFTVFVLALVGMAVFTMLAAAVREHARF